MGSVTMFANTFNRILSFPPPLSRFSLEHDRSTIPAGETASPEERKSSDPVSRPRFKTSLPYQRRPRYRETLETTSIQHSNLLSTVVTFNPPSSPNFRPTNFSVLSLSFSFENRGNRKCDSISWLYYNRYYIEVRRKKFVQQTIILFWNTFRNFDLKIVLRYLCSYLFIYK